MMVISDGWWPMNVNDSQWFTRLKRDTDVVKIMAKNGWPFWLVQVQSTYSTTHNQQ